MRYTAFGSGVACIHGTRLVTEKGNAGEKEGWFTIP
jgi:hypothetical protein